MSFLKRLFGRGESAGPADVAGGDERRVEHLGYVIRATPFKEAGQWQLCGVIAKEIEGETREFRFVRADRFGDVDTATEMAFVKGRLIIAEQGDRLFD